MRLFSFLIIILGCSALPVLSDDLKINPTFKRVTLKEFTSLELNIMPDSGTQLIFPFTLDNAELTPTLKIRLSNSHGFWLPVKEEDLLLLRGQNTITIMGKPAFDNQGNPAAYLANAFITIAGYNISISLKTTFDPSEVTTNIIFDIDNKERNHMIESSVKRRIEALESDYKKKQNELEELAIAKSLKYVGAIAHADRDKESFNFESEIKNINLLAFVDKALAFNDQFYVVNFEFENTDSKRLFFESLSLSVNNDGVNIPLQGEWDCPSDISKYKIVKCSFSSLDKRLLKSDHYEVKILTNKGEGIFKW